MFDPLVASLPRPDWANEQLLPVVLCALLPAMALLIASAFIERQRQYSRTGQGAGTIGSVPSPGGRAGHRGPHAGHEPTADQGEEEWRAFVRAIAARPGDALPRLVFADWLEERGCDREAAAQRWAAEHGKTPDRFSEYNGKPGEWATWFRAEVAHSPRCLPDEYEGAWGTYQTPVDAETALLIASARDHGRKFNRPQSLTSA